MNKRLVLIPISLLSLLISSNSHPNINQIEYKESTNDLAEVSSAWDNSIQLSYINDFNNVDVNNYTNLNNMFIEEKSE